jgi:uncharacterized membrane protein
MLQNAHARVRPVLENRDHGFTWRGGDISRIESLSDGVFAFSVTLLIVSLEVPRTFAQLHDMMRGFLGFGISFVLLLSIWHAQYIYFRRYALADGLSFRLNAALLFVVAFYVYPLKFLFTTLVNRITGYQPMEAGQSVPPMTRGEWSELMMIYSAGFVALYIIFALLYLHAYRQRHVLELTSMEVYETRGVVQENVLMVVVGTAGLLFGAIGQPALAGMSYVLIAPLQTVLGIRHGRQRKRLSNESDQ